MNQLCKVCGEPAAGFHFGAFTCEGCKSFFGRTYNNISAIAGCKNNGDCVINKKNRTACKACRLRKCLLVGMSKSGSRYGRRSNWFKIHCLLQEQQTQQGGATGNGGVAPGGANSNANNNNNNNSSSNNNLEQLARLHQMQARQTYQDKTNPCIKSASLSPTTAAAAAAAAALSMSLPTALSHNHNVIGGGGGGGGMSSTSPHQQAPPTATGHHTTHNFLSAAKFLNGLTHQQHQLHHHSHHSHHHHQQQQQQHSHNHQNHAKNVDNRRLTDTPSDSGASSAGAETNDDMPRTTTTTQPASEHNTEDTRLPRRHNNRYDGDISLGLQSDDNGGDRGGGLDDDDDGGGGGGCANVGDSGRAALLSAIDTEDRRKQFLQIFRSHSEPLRCGPFVPFVTPPPPMPPLAQTPQHQQHQHFFPTALKEEFKRSVSEFAARAAAVAAAAAAAAAQCIQDEPIDLSVKTLSRGASPTATATFTSSAASRCGSSRSMSPTDRNAAANDNALGAEAAVEAELAHAMNNDMNDGLSRHLRKPSPLDLTLVRTAHTTQTLTG